MRRRLVVIAAATALAACNTDSRSQRTVGGAVFGAGAA